MSSLNDKKKKDEERTVDLFAGPGGIDISTDKKPDASVKWIGDFANLVTNLQPALEKEVGKEIDREDLAASMARLFLFVNVPKTLNAITKEKGHQPAEVLISCICHYLAWRILEKETGEKFFEELKKHKKENQAEFLAFSFFLKQKLNSIEKENGKKGYPTLQQLMAYFAQSEGITLQQPNAKVPDTIRAVLTDNQFFNKLLHGENLEKIDAFPTKREDGTPLKGFGLITNRNSPPLTYKDKLILFAALSIADNNKITDTDGKSVGAVTIADIVAQLQPKKIKTAYNKDSEIYKDVEASFEQMRNTKISLVSKDFLKNRRGEELPENHVLAKEQPLIIADRALWARRGNIVAGYLWHDSEPIKMIKEDFDWRFSVQIARDIMPKNLSGQKLNLFAYLLERACNTLPTMNKVYLYGKGREDQQTLLKALNWLDVSLIDRKLTTEERSKDQSQRKQIESILKALESGPFKVERILNPKKKLIGVTVKYLHQETPSLED